MPGYYPSGCDSLIPSHVCDPCEQREYGRIRSAGFIHRDFAFTDPTNATEWQAGIKNKRIIVIPETHGELPEPTEKSGPGYGDNLESLMGYEFHAKFTDPNYAANAEFYNALIGNRNYRFFYRTSSRVHITDQPVTIIPKQHIPDDLNGEVVWTVTCKWQDHKFPHPYHAPDSVFECYVP
jgi:hypothetical protein